MLGTDIAAACDGAGVGCLILDRDEIDICDRASVLARLEPADWVVNCAAFTRVDDAEKERDLAHQINATGAAVAAQVCAGSGTRFLHISTDYVFDGTLGRPYTETDAVQPLNWYGQTKLAAEQLVAAAGGPHVIVRTQSLYGLNGRNFVKAIINQLLQGKTQLRVVADQISSPTYTMHLADALLRLMWTKAQGIVNIASTGHCSWKAFAEAIVAALKPGIPVEPLSTAALNLPALRPAFSVLDTARFTALTGHRMPSWQEGLADYLTKEPLAEELRNRTR